MTEKKTLHVVKWTPEDVSEVKSTINALAKKLGRKPSSIAVKAYDVTVPSQIAYLARQKAKAKKPAKKVAKAKKVTRKPRARKAVVETPADSALGLLNS